MPRRLDIAIKARFFKHLLDGGDPGAETVYRRHILGRTGGVEPGSKKRSVEAYVSASEYLFESMLEHGFNAECPIAVCKTPRLRNGAHRIACSLVLGLGICRVVSEKPGRSPPWGRNELLSCGMGAGAVDRAERDLKELRAQV